MRRALSNIVPVEILERRRKAYVVRSTLNAALRMRASIGAGGQLISASLGILDSKTFDQAIKAASEGQVMPLVTLVRTLRMELWLCRLRDEMLLEQPPGPPRHFGEVQLAEEMNLTKKGGEFNEICKARRDRGQTGDHCCEKPKLKQADPQRSRFGVHGRYLECV